MTAESNPAVIGTYGALGGLLSHGPGAWLPPMWFLGLYEVMLGIDATVFGSLATAAISALGLALAIAGLAYGAGLRRIIRNNVEAPQTGSDTVRPIVAGRLTSGRCHDLTPCGGTCRGHICGQEPGAQSDDTA